MIKEENDLLRENDSTLEEITVNEFDYDYEVISNDEIKKDDLEYGKEDDQPISNKKKNSSKIHAIQAGFVALISTVVISTQTLVNMDMSATLNKFEYADGVIKYDINLSGFTEKNELSFTVIDEEEKSRTYTLLTDYTDLMENNNIDEVAMYDNKNNYIDNVTNDNIANLSNYIKQMDEKNALKFSLITIDDVSINFEVSDNGKNVYLYGTLPLDKDVISEKLNQKTNASIKYKVSLKGDVGLITRTFDNYVIKIDKCISEFREVTGYCNCAIDGYFYFTMDFDDDYGIFTDFEAYIENSNGSIATCTFNQDLHTEQKIYVLDIEGGEAILKINYKVDGVLKSKIINVKL